MNNVLSRAAGALPGLCAFVPLLAQAAEAIERGAVLLSQEGERIARIERVVRREDGSVLLVSVIYKGRLVRIPGDTLSATDEGVRTSLDKKALRRLP